MLKIVTGKSLITKYERLLVKRLKSVCDRTISCNIGYNGGSFPTRVFYSTQYDFWFTNHKNENRYWNAFAVGRPIEGRNVSIDVEINFPFKGINRNIGGAFGQNEKGDIFLLHRGRIGGSKVGGGKQLFIDNYGNKPIIADDDGIDNYFFPIDNLISRFFPKNVSNFISDVHHIKNLTIEDATEFSWLNSFQFTDESTGKRVRKKTDPTTIDLTHGIVVNKLARVLKNKGLQIGKDKNRDIFIHNQGQVKKLFEVKTSSSTQNLYSAVGQLLIYSIPFKKPADLILVLPKKLNKDVVTRLNELGLQVLYYTWHNEEPIFENLDSLL